MDFTQLSSDPSLEIPKLLDSKLAARGAVPELLLSKVLKVKVKALVAQLCPTLCDPMDCSPSGSSVHGILQARIPEWVAIPFSRGSSRPRDGTQFLMSPALAGGFFTTSTT